MNQKRKPSVNLSVTNDVFTDQRVNKMARTLHGMGFNVSITGVRRKNSQPFDPPYASVRLIPLIFHKKFLFYAEYNLKLFFFLLFKRFDLLVSNDLDTLLPNHLVSRIFRLPLVYDTHEYFTGAPEIMNRPVVLNFWKTLEKWLFPRQRTIITVNESIASLYDDQYGKRPHVVRNLPLYKPPREPKPAHTSGLPENRDIILLQGAGINVDRGAEELVEAMRPEHGLKNCLLLIIGSGDVLPALIRKVKHEQLEDRVWFLGKMPHEQLYEYTRHAKIGATLDKDTNLNYRYSLPNKLFDYMMAGTPQLASDLPEIAHIINTYHTGMLIRHHDPAHIAERIKLMLADQTRWQTWKGNCLAAAKTLCWENEEKVVRQIYEPFLG